MIAHYNIFNPRVRQSGPLLCRLPGCGGAVNLQLSDARALLEYRLRDDPASVLRATCRTCGCQSSYDYPTITELTPNDLRPIPLPPQVEWALILLEIPTETTMPQRAFMGERVLVEGLIEGKNAWTGTIASRSQLVPSLQIGDRTGGQTFNDYRVCKGVVRNNSVAPLLFDPPSSGLDVGCFFIPKTGHTSMLQCGNVACANPSCSHYFGFNYSQFKESLRHIAKTEKCHGDGTSGYLLVKCEICQTSRVIDHRTFEGLFKA